MGVVGEAQSGVLSVTESLLEESDEVSVRELVVDMGAVPAGLHEPGVTQGTEMAADGALREFQGVHEGGNALFASDEAEQQLDADGFGEGFENGRDVPEVVWMGWNAKWVMVHAHTLAFVYPDG